MGEPLKFDYYYGVEAEQFSFYRVPRLLIKDGRFKGLSSDAKLLYGLMLDRMAMSMKNGWIDKENRAYIIYSIENIMEDLGCSKPTCIKIIRELDSDKGIGLIEKKRRGLGKPDIIYVKNFASEKEKRQGETDASAEVKDFNLKKESGFTSRGKETELPEVKETDFQKERNFTSGSKTPELQGGKETDLRRETVFTSGSKMPEPQEVKDFAPNYNNINHNNQNYTEMSQINPINQSGNGMMDAIDGTDDADAYMALIRENLEYDYHMKYDGPNDREMFEEIYETVCDIVCVKRSVIRINGEDYPYGLVKSRFLKLNNSHVGYVMGRMRDTVTKITNIRAYLLTALYNAPSTMGHYYQQEVQHDMYGGGWEEKRLAEGGNGNAGQ
ncbi:MAG: replication initiator protein A [Lachnospiraceae bacterium]|nr:replication initiator protein A [Lachnospiraceae bacterium]